MITQELDLNMVPGTVPPVINVSQFDTGARTFVFTLYNGATLFNGPVASCRIEGIKPDNKGFSYNASYSNGKVTADCTEQMTAVVGNVLCEIRLLENNEKTLGTLNFILCVERSPLNADVDISETEIPPIIDLARKHEQAAAASANQAANSASSAANSAQRAENIQINLLNHLNQIDANTNNIAELRTDVNNNTSEINELGSKVNANITDITTLKSNVSNNTSDITVLRSDVNANMANITGLRTDVDANTARIAEFDFEFEQKLNRPEDNPPGELNQLLASNGNGTNSNKWVNFEDMIRDSPFIKDLVRLVVNSRQGVLTVAQGQLTFAHSHITVTNI